MLWYKEKKRAMYREVIEQAGGENCTKEDILNVLFPDDGEGRYFSSGEFYVYWWNNPWEQDSKWWQRLNRVWFFPVFILLIAPIQYLVQGKVGFSQQTKLGEIILNMVGEK